MIRDVEGVDAGMGNTDNPFDVEAVWTNIEMVSTTRFYIWSRIQDYAVLTLLISRSWCRLYIYHDPGKDVHEISATKIRKQMREDGTLVRY